MALSPEFRGSQDFGWSTAHESVRAYDEFSAHLRSLEQETAIRVRIVLSFYNHVAEGAGFYEIPKSLLLTVEGRGNNTLRSRPRGATPEDRRDYWPQMQIAS